MHTPSQEDVSRIVDEVVRRVRALSPPGVVSEVKTAAASGCGCTPEKACSCTTPPAAGAEIIDRGACRIGTAESNRASDCHDLAGYIDHTLLKANATEQEVAQLCAEARQYGFASVCVNTGYVELCAGLLAGSGVKVCCVVGFPLGAMTSESKAFETRDAVGRGADEIDMVINVGKLVSGLYDYVYDDIRAVVRAAAGQPVKVILETGMLNDDQKIAGCVLAKAAGAAFVKTSTGFGPGGATAEDISLMRRIVGEQMGVKASGGIRDCATAHQMVNSGASRLGASASVGIVRGEAGKKGY